MRPEVKWFASIMEEKLKKNDHKGGWHHMSQEELLDRLKQEVKELEDALNENNSDKTVQSSNIVYEAADVANFSMMIAELAHRNLFPVYPKGAIEDEKK